MVNFLWELREETLGDLVVTAYSSRLSPFRFFRKPNIINPITTGSGNIITITSTSISTNKTTKIFVSFPAFFSFRCSG